MNCEEFGRCLDNYENLTAEEKLEMTDHAAMCEKCQKELDFFLAMISTAKSLPPIEPPADFMDTLNKRLDAEDKKAAPSRIVYHVRRNWKQYVTVAACFALVAVITVNRGILLDRIEGTEDGVITETTVDDGDNAVPDSTQQTAAEPETVQQAAGETAAAEPASAPVKSESTHSAPAAVRKTSQASQGAVKSVSEAKTAYVPSSNTPSQTIAPVSAPEAVSTPSAETEQKRSGSDYGIASAGAIRRATETASAQYDLKPEEVSASLRASKVIDSYSLAENGESIALGRYYSIDQNGKPIMDTEDNSAKAIGSLKISSEDAEKAMDVLNQYPHEENGNVYTTGSENVSGILSDLSDEGITYTDYIVGGSEDVKFKVEFN